MIRCLLCRETVLYTDSGYLLSRPCETRVEPSGEPSSLVSSLVGTWFPSRCSLDPVSNNSGPISVGEGLTWVPAMGAAAVLRVSLSLTNLEEVPVYGWCGRVKELPMFGNWTGTVLGRYNRRACARGNAGEACAWSAVQCGSNISSTGGWPSTGRLWIAQDRSETSVRPPHW